MGAEVRNSRANSLSQMAIAVLGAAIVGLGMAVGIAWGAVAWRADNLVLARQGHSGTRQEIQSVLPNRVFDLIPFDEVETGRAGAAYQISYWQYRTSGVSVDRVLVSPGWEIRVVQAGWPFRALMAYRVADPLEFRRGLGARNSLSYQWGVQAPRWLRAEIANADLWPRAELPLPFAPQITGLLGNGACIAIIVFAAERLVRVIRVKARQRRGACMRCGYFLGANGTICPECGLGSV
jgi:hypothetical protein